MLCFQKTLPCASLRRKLSENDNIVTKCDFIYINGGN